MVRPLGGSRVQPDTLVLNWDFIFSKVVGEKDVQVVLFQAQW